MPFSLLSFIVALLALLQAVWTDPAPHRVQLVQVSDGVQLSAGFWRRGRPLVLPAGLGNTAHVLTHSRQS
jgi:hypothetical protein